MCCFARGQQSQAHTMGSPELAGLARAMVDHRTAVADLAGRVTALVSIALCTVGVGC